MERKMIMERNISMEEMKMKLKAREKELLKLKKEKEKALENVPEGNLRISCRGNYIRYYHKRDSKDKSGIYMPERMHDLARLLAQKEYDQEILQVVEKELRAIKKCLLNYPELVAESIYEKLHKGRQKLVKPIWETDEQYAKWWETVQYRGKEIDESVPELYTAKNERVRSKSEVLIADLLNRMNIPYRYEAPIYLKGVGRIYPDFTLLNVKKRKELYWEHLGMMDDPVYVEMALQRIAKYEQNKIFPGDKLIITCETKALPLHQKSVMNIIRHHFE